MAKIAKEHDRTNRDEDMNYFAVYYKAKFAGLKFKDFKKHTHDDQRIV